MYYMHIRICMYSFYPISSVYHPCIIPVSYNPFPQKMNTPLKGNPGSVVDLFLL